MTWNTAFDVAASRLGAYQRLATAPVPVAGPQPTYGTDAWQPSAALAAASWPPPAALVLPAPEAWLAPASPLPPPPPPPPPPVAWLPPAAPLAPAPAPDAWQLPDLPRHVAPEPEPSPAKPAAPRPQPAGPLEVGPIGALTWQHAVDVVRSRGGAVFRNGQPTVLAIRTGNRPTRSWEDHLVVLKPNGEMKVFAGTTRPATRSTAGAALLVPGSYELTPRWKDAKWRNAFIVRDVGGDVTVAVARDRNRDGRYAGTEFTSPSTSDLIRLHPGSSSGGPSSSGCLNVKDYDAFIRFLGGTEVRFGMTLVNA